MNPRQLLLDNALRLLREIDADAQASPAVEAAVQREFHFRQRRRSATPAAWGAVAAMVVAAVALSVRPSEPVASRQPRPSETPRTELATEFIPLQSTPAGPGEFSQVIRVRLPRTELRRFGLAPAYQPLEGTVQADIVLGRDGVAQAVRFVH